MAALGEEKWGVPAEEHTEPTGSVPVSPSDWFREQAVVVVVAFVVSVALDDVWAEAALLLGEELPQLASAMAAANRAPQRSNPRTDFICGWESITSPPFLEACRTS
jgi:hypothetical protein